MAATYSTIGDAMKAYRGMNGLAQRQLGELLGVKQTDISQIENGRKTAPRRLRRRSAPWLTRGLRRTPARPSQSRGRRCSSQS